MERTRFFQLLRTHTIEGMFSDPMHGGNAGLIGWQLIGYPLVDNWVTYNFLEYVATLFLSLSSSYLCT